MDRCDVLIVGGGPSGSTLAWSLRASGLDVRLWDKRRFPRDKTCAGWVTPAVVGALNLDLDDYARARVLQPIHGFRLSHMDGRVVENLYEGEPVSYGIRRFEFDDYLLRRTEVPTMLGEPVKAIVRDGADWSVNGRLKARLLVGAGGHFCPVARSLGAAVGRSELVVAAQEVEFAMPAAMAAACRVRGDIPQLFFCRDLKGYGWVFRKGDYLNIGLGREDNHRLGEHLEEFCAYLESQGELGGAVPRRFKGHAYLLYQHSPRDVVAPGALLIGDAAGLAYQQSGEGIRPAVESALLASQHIVAAGGDFGLQALAPYREALHARFGRRDHPPAPTEAKAPSWLKLKAARLLLGTHWFTRHVVIRRWFLHTQAPELAQLPAA